MPHLGGQTSKISKDLANIQMQLKSGKTHGNNPRELSPEEITALEHRRDSLKTQMREIAKSGITARVNSHTTAETERVIACVQGTTVPAQQYFKAIGGAGSSTDLRAQAKTLIERANAMDRESKKAAPEQQKAEQKALKDAQRKADSDKRKAEKFNSKPNLPEQKRRTSQQSQVLVPRDASPCGTLSAQAAAQKAAIEDMFLADLDSEDDSSTCPF
jgi:hypothetical protein